MSAVRDLFGTMQNEGASKGILVTTSGYGKSSFDFAAGKPLELLSGTHLLYLLAENANIEARIEPPERLGRPDRGRSDRRATSRGADLTDLISRQAAGAHGSDRPLPPALVPDPAVSVTSHTPSATAVTISKASMIRRTLVALGVDPGAVMDQLGHTDPSFTLRVYRHGMRRDAASRTALRELVGLVDWVTTGNNDEIEA